MLGDEATQSARARLDASVFFDGLRRKQLPSVSLNSFLVCRAILYAAIEQKITQSDDLRLKKMWGLSSFKLPSLLKSMRLSHVEKSPVVVPAVRAALQLAAEIVAQPSQGSGSFSLLGFLYALENFQLDAPSAMSEWMGRFRVLPFREEDVRLYLTSLEAGFVALEKVLSALFPYSEEQLKYHICSVNPEAGSHAIPQDPLEIEVALQAGVRSFDRFPYLKERYGERGERFTASDSCWLVTLIPDETAAIQESIAWLQTLLEKRGVPLLILESHLEEIIRSFESMIPERKESLKNFSTVALAMKGQRFKWKRAA